MAKAYQVIIVMIAVMVVGTVAVVSSMTGAASYQGNPSTMGICDETDGGYNPDKYGETWMYGDRANADKDYCIMGKNAVYEYFCDANRIIQHKEVVCDENEDCREGACVRWSWAEQLRAATE